MLSQGSVRCYEAHRLRRVGLATVLWNRQQEDDTMTTTTQLRQGKETPAQPVLLAFDLGLKTWKLGFARDFSDTPWVREIAGGDGEMLCKAIAQAKQHFQLPATIPVRSC
jgi:hypothetical protein